MVPGGYYTDAEVSARLLPHSPGDWPSAYWDLKECLSRFTLPLIMANWLELGTRRSEDKTDWRKHLCSLDTLREKSAPVSHWMLVVAPG